MLINAINLIFPDNSVPPPTLTTDASKFAAGAQLDQFLQVYKKEIAWVQMKNSACVSCAHLLKSPSTAEQSLFCKLVVNENNMKRGNVRKYTQHLSYLLFSVRIFFFLFVERVIDICWYLHLKFCFVSCDNHYLHKGCCTFYY